MKQSYYLYRSGRIQRKDNTLEIVYKDNTKKSIPVERVDDIYVMTEFDFNTTLLNFLSQYGINVHFFNYYGFYTGTYYPKESLVSGKLLIKQVESYTNKEKRLKIAKAFIEAASYNIYRNLTYYNNRGKDLSDYMKEIEFLRTQIPLTKDVQELMGIEGNIRKIYYNTWNIIINQDIAFEKRVKNPPDNAINSLISYVNTIIYTRVLIEIYMEYHDKLSVGDKITNLNANKNIIMSQYSNEDAPYTDFRPNEAIDAINSCSAIDGRMICSPFLVGGLNKLMIELWRKSCDILGIKWPTLHEIYDEDVKNSK